MSRLNTKHRSKQNQNDIRGKTRVTTSLGGVDQAEDLVLTLPFSTDAIGNDPNLHAKYFTYYLLILSENTCPVRMFHSYEEIYIQDSFGVYFIWPQNIKDSNICEISEERYDDPAYSAYAYNIDSCKDIKFTLVQIVFTSICLHFTR